MFKKDLSLGKAYRTLKPAHLGKAYATVLLDWVSYQSLHSKHTNERLLSLLFLL